MRADGMFTMPLIGDVPVVGLTPSAAADSIAKRLDGLVLDPRAQHLHGALQRGLAAVVGPSLGGMTALAYAVAAGDDVEAVTIKALSTYEEFELVTLYCGDSEGGGASADLCERIELSGFGAEVEVINGGQPHDHLLVAVE